MVNHKQNIIDALKIMRDNSKVNGEIFKVKAYEKVIRNLELISVPIISYKQIENIEGAGKNIKLKFREIIDKGHLDISVDNIKMQLLQIYGIGPVKAQILVDDYKIKSIEELREKIIKEPKLLTESQKIGLKYYDDFLERIPRKEMLKHEKNLNLPKNKGEIVGSFRRGESDSGDIDVLLNLNENEFKEFINKLKEKNYLVHVLAEGSKKLLGVCKLKGGKYRRLDLIRNTPEEYPYCLLYFTGSKNFNVAFRGYCLGLNLSLNEHSFTPPVKGLLTEKDIFSYVGLKYKEPKDRIDTSSIVLLKK